MDLVVDVWQVGLGGSLTNTTEFVIDRSVTKANPTLVSSEIWDGNATQMSAHSRDSNDLRVTSVGNIKEGFFIELSIFGESVGVVDFGHSQTTDENKLSIPVSLDNFTWG